jgi:hypothetical protein
MYETGDNSLYGGWEQHQFFKGVHPLDSNEGQHGKSCCQKLESNRSRSHRDWIGYACISQASLLGLRE